jgi:hypothetical protein
MAAQQITKPTKYKHALIAPAAGGFDVFDGDNRWFHCRTQKQAKWWSSIHSRLQDEFGSNPPRTAPAPVEDHTPKQKEQQR